MFQIKRTVELTDDWEKLQSDTKQVLIDLLPSWSDVEPSDIQVRCAADLFCGDASSLSTRLKQHSHLHQVSHSITLSGTLQVDKMSGGITNVLLKLAAPEGAGPGPVALRVFGDNTDILIDRHEELDVLLRLNAAGFGAPVSTTPGALVPFASLLSIPAKPAWPLLVRAAVEVCHSPLQVLGTFSNGRVEAFIPYKPLESPQLCQPNAAAAIAGRLAQLHTVQIPGSGEAQIFSKIYTW